MQREKLKSKIHCNSCNLSTNHEILVKHSENLGNEDYWATGDWSVIKCCGCDSISFLESIVTQDDIHPETDEMVPTEKIFPDRGKGKLPTNFYIYASNTVRRIYRETIESFNRELYTLCAAGLRAIIEGICTEKSIKDGPVEETDKAGAIKIIRKSDLRGKINGLFEAGILTKQHSTALHELRFLGNNAIHELQIPDQDGLRVAIEIIEHTMKNVYELDLQAQALREHRQKKNLP